MRKREKKQGIQKVRENNNVKHKLLRKMMIDEMMNQATIIP